MIVILDSGIVDLLTSSIQSLSKKDEGEIYQCNNWFYGLLAKGVYIVSSDIVDYEVRRKFIHIKSEGLSNLDNLKEVIEFLPLTLEVMRQSAELWAKVREIHRRTADDKALDVDMIISAHWKILSAKYPGRYIVVATNNLSHLKLFCEAQKWRDITF